MIKSFVKNWSWVLSTKEKS